MDKKTGGLKCDYCEQRATMICRDVIETHTLDGRKEFNPAPTPIRNGCDEHPVESRTIAISQSWMNGL